VRAEDRIGRPRPGFTAHSSVEDLLPVSSEAPVGVVHMCGRRRSAANDHGTRTTFASATRRSTLLNGRGLPEAGFDVSFTSSFSPAGRAVWKLSKPNP
jgi:hypothetical protein